MYIYKFQHQLVHTIGRNECLAPLCLMTRSPPTISAADSINSNAISFYTRCSAVCNFIQLFWFFFCINRREKCSDFLAIAFQQNELKLENIYTFGKRMWWWAIIIDVYLIYSHKRIEWKIEAKIISAEKWTLTINDGKGIYAIKLITNLVKDVVRPYFHEWYK